MPLSKLFQYAHCALLYSGCATQWRCKTEDELARDRAAVERLKAKRKTKNPAK